MAFFSQVGLLLWKNWILQRRRICVSIFEIILPLILAAMLLLLRSYIGTEVHDKPTLYPPEDIISDCDFTLSRHNLYNPNGTAIIGFSPSVKAVQDVMSYLQTNMNESLTRTYPPSLKGFKDEDALVEYAKNYPGKIALGIAFLNIESGQGHIDPPMPKDVRFAIRPPTNDRSDLWDTSRTYPAFQGNDPRHILTNDLYKDVLCFQTKVAEALTKYWTDKSGGKTSKVRFQIQTQRLPFPPYIQDPMINIVQASLSEILVLSLIISVIINTKNLVYEKENKLKESMKLMGLLGSAHWVSWFITFSFYLIPVLLVFAIFLGVPFDSEYGAVLQESDTSVVFAFLLAYGMATITFCFMVGSFVQKANMASVLSGLLFYCSNIPKFYIDNNYQQLSKSTKLSLCLLSNCGMTMGANIIGLYEGTGEGVQWSNFHRPATVDDNISLLDCILMLLVDSAIHLVIFWYLDNVRPGDFGVPQPYHFCFTKSYWFGQSQKRASFSRQKSEGGEKTLRFEVEPENLKAGIEINGLTKVFGKNTAVNGVSLNMYEGQITALLGHNGAGKTTTMSVLTGFIPPSNGTAFVNGYDIRKDMRGVRSSLGLCPQHNILFETLTVKEHLQLFARLKGATNNEADQEIDPLLVDVGLSDKSNVQTQQLSGGQKRKLSVAIALIAGSKIVILDEPSSGMDPGARRQTWSVLQKRRAGRTILLTTHYMDEADVLGDRIAIMAEGVVKCCGTSMFLKKLYGAGYHLVVVKDLSCCVTTLTKVIQSHVTSAIMESQVGQEVTYLLPDRETAKFPLLFTELEGRKSELGIGSFGTSATTMEEVFLKVGESAHHHDDTDDNNLELNGGHQGSICATSDPVAACEKTPLTESNGSGAGSGELGGTTVKFSNKGAGDVEVVDLADADVMKFSKGYNKKTGLGLEFGKMRGIMVKKAIHTWRNRIVTLVQLLLPVIFACLALGIDRVRPDDTQEPPLTLDLSPFDPTIIPTASVSNDSDNKTSQFESLYSQQFNSRHEVRSFQLDEHQGYDNYTLKLSESLGIGTFNKRVIIGMEVSQTETSEGVKVVSHYNGEPLHAETIGLNYAMNAFLQFYLNQSYSLQMILHPLPLDMEEDAFINIFWNVKTGIDISFLISFGMAFLTALFAYYYIKERKVGAKHLQVVSGVSPLTYWLPSFLWDFITYLVPCLCLLIVFAACGTEAFIGGVRPAVLLLHLLMYAWAFLPCMYFVQFVFTNPATGVNVIITVNVLTGLVFMLTVRLMRASTLKDTADVLDLVFMLVFPNYNMGQGLVDVYTNYQFNKMCAEVECNAFVSHPCCSGCEVNCYEYSSYLSWESPGIGRNMAIFFITGISYFVLVFLVEYNILQKIGHKAATIFYRSAYSSKSEETTSLFQDSDVAHERERINASSPEELRNTDSVLLVNLNKRYGPLVAVDHICLGVPSGECFGLLGQNGAGKTTTFKMLTGEVMPTGGNAYVSGYDVYHNTKQAQSNMGYCPQFDALIDEMTGRETLTLYARLRGVPESNIKDVVDGLVSTLMLVEHADKRTSAYSGGTKRKLSTAISLVGLPDFIMLDEPTAGMDPKTRRQLWTVLSKVRDSGRTLVLTSHSMEECEALCTRMAIMVNGRFACVGSGQHLKSKFGQGYTLVVHLGVEEDGSRAAVQPLMDYLGQHLPGIKVFDGHQGYVHFQVPDSTVQLGNVFGLMEATKQYFNIQDYSVHQTTLEQVFLTFTRTQAVQSDVVAKKQGCMSCL